MNPFKNMNDKELIEEWKSLVVTNEVYGSISLPELYTISTIKKELQSRKNVNIKELEQWKVEQVEKKQKEDKAKFFKK